jgi:hypothetical protein
MKPGVLGSVPRPWEIVGRLAAQVHAIDPARVRDLVPGHAARHAHAHEALAAFDGATEPELLSRATGRTRVSRRTSRARFSTVTSWDRTCCCRPIARSR